MQFTDSQLQKSLTVLSTAEFLMEYIGKPSECICLLLSNSEIIFHIHYHRVGENHCQITQMAIKL